MALLLYAATAGPVCAESVPPPTGDDLPRPDGVHILDGSYVLDIGEFFVNITNHGLIGSQYSSAMPYSSAPSGQWPGGSGHEYLWGAGLWVGGIKGGNILVSTGQLDREFRPTGDLRDVIYEAKDGIVTRPDAAVARTGRRAPDGAADDDGDGRRDEDLLNGRDDDGDGRVDEDFGQIGDQMFTCTMFDNLPLIREIYPAHEPLNLKVVQRAVAWYADEFDDIVGLDYEITNVGYETIEDAYVGFYVDCDIQRREMGSNDPDDRAGLWRGAVRAGDNTFHRIELAYMLDAAPQDPLPGWFGVAVLDHTTDFMEWYAPHWKELTGYQIFATNATTYQDGEPLSDTDRYELMAKHQYDRNTREDEAADLKFLISSGPFPHFDAGRTITYRLALVMGDGPAELLQNTLTASVMARGQYYNLDNDYYMTGQNAYETLVCLGDYPPWQGGDDPLFGFRYDFMDETCVGGDPVFGFELVRKELMFTDEDGRTCMWVNADNCEECYRAMGRECTVENGLYWAFYYGYSKYRHPQYFTGVGGREARVPWVYSGELAPLLPNLRLSAGDNQVEVFWDDRSEYEPDFLRGVIDFESYRVWRVASWLRPPGASEEYGPPSNLWEMVAEFDVVNEIPAGVANSPNVRPLGLNTGLEPAVYTPACLSDPRFAGLAEAMDALVQADVENRHLSRPPLRAADGIVLPGMAPLVPWETWPAVLDTFFAVTERIDNPALGVIGKRAIRYYHFLDTQVHNGFSGFYAVTAADHALTLLDDQWVPAGYGLQRDPGNNFLPATPSPTAQTPAARRREGVNIYVYPNPATRDALAEFAQQPPTKDDPTGVRVMFNNLPAALNTITIYSASGDLIQTIEHDGRPGSGAVSWNLMSRNGQEVVSGIYLYVVKSAGGQFEDFQGKFVVVR